MRRLTPVKIAMAALLLPNFFTAAFAYEKPNREKLKLDGDIHGGGGNGTSAEFYDMVKHFVKSMHQVGSTVDPEFPLKELSERIPTLEILPKDGPLLLRGKRVDAINYPAFNVIEFDYSALNSYPLERRYQIVIHELLGLLDKDDVGYDRSLRLSRATLNGLEGVLDLNPAFHVSRDFNSCYAVATYDTAQESDGFEGKVTCQGIELFSKQFRQAQSNVAVFLENAESRLKSLGFKPSGCEHTGNQPQETYAISLCHFSRGHGIGPSAHVPMKPKNNPEKSPSTER